MRQKLFLIFSTAIILSNIWLVMKNQTLKDNYSGLENNYFELKREKNKIEVLNSKIQDQMLYNWENEGQELAHEKLKEYLSKQINCLPPKVKYPKLIFRYSQLTCQTCADSQIDLLKEASEIIGNENIIIIPSYEKEQNFVLFKQQNQISFGMTNVDSLRIPIEKYNLPYYFVWDQENRIKSFFFPQVQTPGLTKKYLEFIQTRYYNKSP